MRNIPQAMKDAIRSGSIHDLWPLVEIDLRGPIKEGKRLYPQQTDLDGQPILRRVLRRTASVVWQGETYYGDNGGWSPVGENTNQDGVFFDLTLLNTKHPVTGVIRPFSVMRRGIEFNECPVTLRFVLGRFDDPAYQIEWDGYEINGFKLKGAHARFRCGLPTDTYNDQVPEVSTGGQFCIYDYKDENCQSDSDLDFCDYTFEACAQRHVRPRITPYPYHSGSVVEDR